MFSLLAAGALFGKRGAAFKGYGKVTFVGIPHERFNFYCSYCLHSKKLHITLMNTVTQIILCGGSGTRLWPVSRLLFPKQFAPILGRQSLYQQTILRNHMAQKNLVITNDEHYFLALEQLEDCAEKNSAVKVGDFILEPVGRNTAPAIALGAMACEPDEILLVVPSDHMIPDDENYQKSVNRAIELAAEGALVTFGIAPLSPETGYGYIRADGENVLSFHEKPDAEKAQAYLDAGDYFWNSGIFCFRAGVFLDELKKHSPEIYEASQKAWEGAKRRESSIRISPEAMLAIPEDSIDYAVMEKSENVRMVRAQFEWSDMGSFRSFYDLAEKDTNENAAPEDVIMIDSHRNYIRSEKQVALIGVEDICLIDTSDALLVSRMDQVQKVKDVVAVLKEKGSDLYQVHTTGYRPWGTYTVLEEGPGYKIKRIEVKPGKRLSLQLHQKRSEHWVVISGEAIVRVGDNEQKLSLNESTYIPIGEVHRLSNLGQEMLVIIEVQVGGYLGEDDIQRLEDDYQRS